MEETKLEKNETELQDESGLGQNETQIETEVERARKKRREAIFEFSLFFILGVLVGITLKTEAVKRVTMGFNDYQIQKPAQSYDVTAIKKKLEAEFAKQQEQQAQQLEQAQEAAQQQK